MSTPPPAPLRTPGSAAPSPPADWPPPRWRWSTTPRRVSGVGRGRRRARGAAYVVNEWIDGETLAERLTRGPMPDREVRTVLRRLAEGVAEAHRVGLAVGGLTPDNVVLRPNGLVGLGPSRPPPAPSTATSPRWGRCSRRA
ncbi:hypothetical protein [Blastococcus brunescens]|uniref:Protein kinase domain-containing protein n=1 Tax=Blastococcus brunescens TaxID=1564165 RepID=A0ABZ1AZ01_9ACTN|nr:hypothetical protein [Blastococcus sp. BMG 8361]WRL63791.1 hypothetical protein U6N30_29845 [Blastococcus sp. BMG 8361]